MRIVYWFIYTLGVTALLLTAACDTYESGPKGMWGYGYAIRGYDIGYSVQETSDNGFVVTGGTSLSVTDDPDIFLMKTYDDGAPMWTEVYGGEGWDIGTCVHETDDGCYFVLGITESFGLGTPGAPDIYLLKVRADGDTVWTRTYGGAGDEAAYSLLRTPGGSFIVIGLQSGSGAFVFEIDIEGNVLWTQIYGGKGLFNGYYTSDGGYIFVGTKAESLGTKNDILLVKANSNGDSAWTRTIGTEYDDFGSAITETADGRYVVVGHYRDGGQCYLYVVGTDTQGNQIWEESYHIRTGTGCYVEDVGGEEYILAGSAGWNPSSCLGPGPFLTKVDSSGDIIWVENYKEEWSIVCNSGQRVSDGGFMLVGYEESSGTTAYVYLLRTQPYTD
jgi:hypothetical protein